MIEATMAEHTTPEERQQVFLQNRVHRYTGFATTK